MMNKKVVLICLAVLVTLLLIAAAAKTLKLFVWLMAAVGLYAIYSVVTNKVKTLKRKV